MPLTWIKTRYAGLLSIIVLSTGCASSVQKVVPEQDGKTMKDIYQQYTGVDEQADYRNRAAFLKMRDQMHIEDTADRTTGFPPQAEQLEHLFPPLPNPELFMYVRPHAVGRSGVPIPAYVTRFSMYERNHYALPGETAETVRRTATVEAALQERAERLAADLEEEANKSDSTRARAGQLRRHPR